MKPLKITYICILSASVLIATTLTNAAKLLPLPPQLSGCSCSKVGSNYTPIIFKATVSGGRAPFNIINTDKQPPWENIETGSNYYNTPTCQTNPMPSNHQLNNNITVGYCATKGSTWQITDLSSGKGSLHNHGSGTITGPTVVQCLSDSVGLNVYCFDQNQAAQTKHRKK